MFKELQCNKDKSFNNLKRKLKWYEKNELKGIVLLFLMLTTIKWLLLLRNAFCISWVACAFQMNRLYMFLLSAELRDTLAG